MWKHARGYRCWVLVYATLACLAIIVSLCVPMVIARFMNAVQHQRGDELIHQVFVIMGLYLGLEVLFWLLHGPSRVIETVVAFRVKQNSQSSLLNKSTALPMRWHRDHHSGETIDQVAKATQALHDFTEGGFEVLHLMTRFIGAVVVLFWIMPAAATAVVTIGVLAITCIILFDRVLTRQYAVLNKRFNEVAASIQDYLTNIATVKSLRLEKRVTGEVDERTGKILPLYRKNSYLNELKWFTSSIFVAITRAGVLLAYVLVMTRGDHIIEIGTLYALYEYLRAIGDSFFQFTYKYGDLIVKSSRVEAIEHIEESFDHEVRESAKASLPQQWKHLEIRNLRFSHTEADDPDQRIHIDNLSCVLERGKSYALVGESGSGKSTALGLLRGIHRAQEASVLVAGKPLEHGMAHIEHHTTLIPQDPEIFSDSVLFNITLGVDTPEEAVLEAIRLARFEPVLRRLERGLDTSIAEKGVSLSGGERQRLALARGLFFAKESKSQIILLDEPTSSVDIFNERRIYEHVLNHFQDRCVLSAIHRFNLLHLFDEILVFENGKMVESGSLDELIDAGGTFAHLWSNHASDGDQKVTAN